MKKLLAIFSTLALASCANYENFYLNNYSVEGNLQEKSTAELAYKNLVYAKVLTDREAIEQFGPDGDNFTVVYFMAENNSNDVSYFNFEDALISNNETNKVKNTVALRKILRQKRIDLNDEDVYRNPFEDTEMEDNNFAYNLNNKVLKDFALQPNDKAKGFLLFNKLRQADELQFKLSSGVSIYTTRLQTVKLDQD